MSIWPLNAITYVSLNTGEGLHSVCLRKGRGGGGPLKLHPPPGIFLLELLLMDMSYGISCADSGMFINPNRVNFIKMYVLPVVLL